MYYEVPKYSKSKVNKAGKILSQLKTGTFDIEEQYDILNNWRSSHVYPLNTIQMNLRRIVEKVTDDFIVAQRLKRTPSIINKLYNYPKMSLTQMQDIGGCRAVLDNISQIREIIKYYEKSRMRHIQIDIDDYLIKPKISGYRGIHLIYKYKSDRNDVYNGMRIEIQLRTKLQHAWATAVETISSLLETYLKSSEGPKVWLDFFKLVGSYFAYMEKSELVPEVTTNMNDLVVQIKESANKLNVLNKLETYGMAGYTFVEENPFSKKGKNYYLLMLNADERALTVHRYNINEFERASNDYNYYERRIKESSNNDIVLVSSDSTEALKKAYNNYFLDTHNFMSHLEKIISD